MRGTRPPGDSAVLARSERFCRDGVCQGVVTAAGTRVRAGVVAADPAVLPLRTVIRVAGLMERYDRVYTVLDTGRAIRGRRIDLYIHNCREAIRFGRRRQESGCNRVDPGAKGSKSTAEEGWMITTDPYERHLLKHAGHHV